MPLLFSRAAAAAASAAAATTAAAAAAAAQRCLRANGAAAAAAAAAAALSHFSSVSAAQGAPAKPSPAAGSQTLNPKPSTENPKPQTLNLTINTQGDPYDVFIIGGGVAGTALLYELAAFTNIKKIGLVERRQGFGLVQSHPRNNSQTIHCGDIETNYTLQKAKVVKRQADMLRNFATKLPPETRDKVIFRFPKMALAVGEEECDFMKKRFQTFKPLFSSLQLVGKTEICELEPRVGLKSSSSPREDEVCGLFVANEHTAVNYISLAEAFVSAAKEAAAGKQLDFSLGTEVLEIKREDKNLFSLITDKGIKKARFVVVSACGHSLLFAQRLGYGREFSCLPVAGSFYFADTMLNGKVYTVQDPRLPFAAVHGDPDILLQGKTRFGPTALPLPLLERNNLKTFFDFAKCVKPDWRLAQVYVQLLNTAYMRAYVFKNFLFEVPKLNLHLFANDLRKIIPSIQVEDLTYAKGFGGIRPQLINKVEKKLLLGEGKIVTGENIIFNITPSPGGTTCLGTAETDMREIARELQAKIDEEKFKKILLQGEYPVGN